MKRTILAARLEVARKRIITAVLETAVDPALLDGLRAAVAEKRAEVRQLAELEALAPIVEQLGTAAKSGGESPGLSAEAVLAIPGLTATSRKAIEAYLDSLVSDAHSD